MEGNISNLNYSTSESSSNLHNVTTSSAEEQDIRCATQEAGKLPKLYTVNKQYPLML